MDEKRQRALERLRANRGKERTVSNSTPDVKADSVKVLIKGFREGYRSYKDELAATEPSEEVQVSSPEDADSEVTPESLPRVAKAVQRLQEKEQNTVAAIARLKEARQRLKQIRKERQDRQATSVAGEAEPSSAETEPPKRQQIRQDLLTADFFKGASEWLNTIGTDPRLSSSSIEEVEALYKEAQYRQRVLKIMLEDTQRELDSFEVYLRMARAAAQPEASEE